RSARVGGPPRAISTPRRVASRQLSRRGKGGGRRPLLRPLAPPPPPPSSGAGAPREGPAGAPRRATHPRAAGAVPKGAAAAPRGSKQLEKRQRLPRLTSQQRGSRSVDHLRGLAAEALEPSLRLPRLAGEQRRYRDRVLPGERPQCLGYPRCLDRW